MEHELPRVLDGVDEPVTVEELEAVVRRAGQRRRATLAAGAAVLVTLGAVGGALARGPGDDRTTGFASTPGEARPPDATSASGAGPSPFLDKGAIHGPAMNLTSLFRRDANGVAVRAYRATWGASPIPTKPECAPPDVIRAELSNTAAVGMAFGPEHKGDELALLGAGRFGEAEGEPVTWAIVRAGGGVSTVRLRLAEATDTMAPQGGIGVLAVPGRTGDGVVEGVDAGGQVVASLPLSELAHPAMDPACVPTDCMTIHDRGAGSGGPAAPPPTSVPAQAPATTAVPAGPLQPPEQASHPSIGAKDDPGTSVHPADGEVVCGVAVPPPPGSPPPEPPFDGSSQPATATTSTTARAATSTTAASPASTSTPNPAP